MAKYRAVVPRPDGARPLVGYRLLRGFVLFVGCRHQAFLRGVVVAAEDPVVPLLFRGGAVLEQVTR